MNADLTENSPDMSVTRLVSQSGMSALPAAPQSAPPDEQQFSPEGTALRQLSTAVFSAALSANAAASAPGTREAYTAMTRNSQRR